jgi:hypothetical protein
VVKVFRLVILGGFELVLGFRIPLLFCSPRVGFGLRLLQDAAPVWPLVSLLPTFF